MKRPFRNLLSLSSGDLGSRMIGFAVSVYLARVLEPTGFGLMSVGLSVLGYLQLAGSPGIQVLETRNAAALAVVDQTRVSAVLSLRFVLAAGLWILTACVVSLLMPHTVAGYVIALFALSLFPYALTADWFFQGREDFLTIGISRVLQFSVYGVAVVLLVHGAEDVNLAAIAFVTGTAVAAAVLWGVYVHRWGALRPVWSLSVWKDILARGLPVGAAMFLAQSVTNLPPLAIGYFSSTVEVGLFSSAMKLVFLLLIIDRLFNSLFLPVVSRYFSLRPGELNILVGTTLRVVLAVVIPLTVAGIMGSGPAMTALFGAGYEQGSVILQMLMCYFGLTVLNSVFVCILIGSGHENEYTRTLTWGSTVLCFAVVAGTVWFGARGAACGVACGELVTMGLMMKESAKVISVPLGGIVLPPIIAGICMAGSGFALGGAGLVPAIVLSLLVFTVVQILLKGITIREIQFLRERFV